MKNHEQKSFPLPRHQLPGRKTEPPQVIDLRVLNVLKPLIPPLPRHHQLPGRKTEPQVMDLRLLNEL